MNLQNCEQVIIWVPSQTSRRRLTVSLYSRICVGWTKELSVFCFLLLDRKTSYQMQGKWYNLE
jgi:hypothetical protein